MVYRWESEPLGESYTALISTTHSKKKKKTTTIIIVFLGPPISTCEVSKGRPLTHHPLGKQEVAAVRGEVRIFLGTALKHPVDCVLLCSSQQVNTTFRSFTSGNFRTLLVVIPEDTCENYFGGIVTRKSAPCRLLLAASWGGNVAPGEHTTWSRARRRTEEAAQMPELLPMLRLNDVMNVLILRHESC